MNRSILTITPLSSTWKRAIEKRIDKWRLLTMEAVNLGAKKYPGQFWNLPGTFLFAVHTLTMLGFGAPSPQTLWGRLAAIIYAIVAIPTHIYLSEYISKSEVTLTIIIVCHRFALLTMIRFER
ncbi:hypothetical protein ACJJTC_006123 [Scirpophaga incertulas]